MNHPKGFTLIELIIVIAVIAILVGVAVPVMGTVLDEARISRAKSDVDAIAKATLKLYEHTTYWPANNAGGSKDITTTASWNEPRNGLTGDKNTVAVTNLYPGHKGPYIIKITDDPWGSSYYLDGPGRLGNQDPGTGQISVMSNGPNKGHDNSRNRADRTSQVDDIVYYFR